MVRVEEGVGQREKRKVQESGQREERKVQDQGDDSFLPVCSVSWTVTLQLLTNNDMLQVRPESFKNKMYAVRSRYS